jgi:nitrate/TMAO reductase-like tetraheme cytochrome c subunit
MPRTKLHVKEAYEAIRDYLAATMRLPLGFVGVCLTSLAGISLIIVTGLELTGVAGNPYLGILMFLIIPAAFTLGLALMPLSHFFARRRKIEVRGAPVFPHIDLNEPRTRNRFVLFLSITLLNLVIVAFGIGHAIEFMDSVTFCGKICHAVMAPELIAHQDSPHARVLCVDCHIGPGASWFVRSKLSGTRQVFASIFHTYPRPVPTPVHNLRPSRDTCEQCHWPAKFHGTKIVTRTKYQEDEASSPVQTVLALKIGGGAPAHGEEGPPPRLSEYGSQAGIHWHIGNRVDYIADEERMEVDRVRVHLEDGSIREFRRPGFAEKAAAEPDSTAGIWRGARGLLGMSASAAEDDDWPAERARTMDCVDCHNRPTHIYRSAADAVNLALFENLISTSIPYVRREALIALTAKYETTDSAMSGIERRIRTFYRENYPEMEPAIAAELAAAIQGMQEVYRRNVFPEMNIGWDTYPSFIGHEQSPGCFRCHDGEMATAEGETISQECTLCHTLLAVEEENPEILRNLFPEE